MDGTAPSATPDADLALCVAVRTDFEEVVGAILMDHLGPFSLERTDEATSTLVFYPGEGDARSDDEVLALLGADLQSASSARIERRIVQRDWTDSWKDHFHPVVIGAVRVRPPWEPALADVGGKRTVRGRRRPRKESHKRPPVVDITINPGLGFGTGQHPTTRGTLQLLQEGALTKGKVRASRGRLVDVGTGSGILAIAAAKLDWEPVIALDIDPFAVAAARANISANGVAHLVQVWEARVETAGSEWFEGATVLANMTLEPLLSLLGRWAPGTVSVGRERSGSGAHKIDHPHRLVVSGILVKEQESRLLSEAQQRGFLPGLRLEEAGWVSMELFPLDPSGVAAATE